MDRIKNILLFSIILLLPTQLGIHFWPSFSFVAGFRIDYLSPTIYLTDILILVYIVFSTVKGLTLKGIKIKSLPASLEGSDLIVILASVFFILLNTLFSNSIPLTLISWIRIIFYLVFFLSLRQEKNLLKKIQTPLVVSTVFIIGLEIAQLIKQESLNGIFYWFGERQFNLSTPNIAKINPPAESAGFQLLRPYATFSHPNSLAGFLLLTFIITKKYLLGRWRTSIRLLQGGIFLGIILTFSKTAILALAVIFIYQKLNPKFQSIFFRIILFLSLTISLLPLFVNQINIPFNPSSTILSRLYLGTPTLQIIKDNLFFGVGLNNFIPALSNQIPASHIFVNTLQPIHSIPLLALSELGLIGVVILISLLRNVQIHSLDGMMFLIILAITGSVDHYWWTLHQNQLMIVLVLALLISPHEISNTNHKH